MTEQSTESATLSAADRFAIADLYYNYSFAFDGGELERIATFFTADATFEIPGMDLLVGQAAMTAFADGATKGGLGVRHVLSGVVAEAAPFGATTRAYVQVFKYEESAVRLIAFGEYADDLVQGPDGWAFRARHFHFLNPPALGGLVLAEAA
ncbi:MAG: nuclear transport factor 2 [Frankiales bacterium]|nr:nuclear transport factor 2 [Frankiales bacterium]